MQVFYAFNQDGTLNTIVQYSRTGSTVPEGYFKVVEFKEPLPSGNVFYDAESNSILFMKEVEENEATINVIDHDKEPIYL